MARLFEDDQPLAARQPRTDPLILKRLLDNAGRDNQLEADAAAVHPVIVRWAELDSRGRLAEMHETQLQGLFCTEILGQILGYTAITGENQSTHYLEQEFNISGVGSPDAVLGVFKPGTQRKPLAVVELKGPGVHLDRARTSGRNAIAQCWDYLYALPAECRWGIVSNFISFRLYDRTATTAKYEHFTLQSLRDFSRFRCFYSILHRKGLIESTAGQTPRTVELIQKTNDRQREVGDKLYAYYSEQRTNLIAHLIADHQQTLEHAIEMAQRLFDRVIFIAFCEDRGLLPGKSLKKAFEGVQSFAAVTNPRWQNYKNLFRFIDVGSHAINPNLPETQRVPAYNGGLFAPHPVDDLELADEPWTEFFRVLGEYDFSDEVNLDVLGHLFERSITEIEKLKATGLFGGDLDKARRYAAMPQSAKRKQLGVYYTPAVLTERIVRYTVDQLIDERFGELAVRLGDADRATPTYWQGCFDILRQLKVVDPACGSGAFLFQAYQTLSLRYGEVIDQLVAHGLPGADALSAQVPRFILNDNLYGVDLSPEAVEITQLALWVQSADQSQTLATLSRNIVHGNSLVHDPDIHPHGFDWKEKFPEVFADKTSGGGGGFDCVIGNPPWERIKLQEREFFSLPAPDIATATNAAKRRQLVAKLESEDPGLHARYHEALRAAESLLTYCRKSKRYPLTGKGDINTYAVFAELATRLVAPRGRVGLLVPSGIASDMTTKDFFADVAENHRLIRLYDFENRTKKLFPEVDGRFKFSILSVGGSATRCDEADFIFFAHDVEEIEDRKRHVKLSGEDIKLLNPNTRTCPIFRSSRDASITRGIYRRVPVLVNHAAPRTGNPWGIKFKTMFHQTNDAERFREAETLKAEGFTLEGNRWVRPASRASARDGSAAQAVYLPLYEAKMVQAYNHRAADVVTDGENWVRQGQTRVTSPHHLQSAEHLSTPRFWIDDEQVALNAGEVRTHFLCFKDVTSPTNQRTMIASFIPWVGVVNSAPIVQTGHAARLESCLLANLNSYAFDYIARQKVGNVHLNFFIVEQIPTFAPDHYDNPCPWDPRPRPRSKLADWISERVLKLSCTAEDMLPLADACGFTAGQGFGEAYQGRLNKWNERERAGLRAELDAAYFILYGLDRGDAEYVLSTFKGIHAASPLLGGASPAEHVLNTFDELSARSMGR